LKRAREFGAAAALVWLAAAAGQASAPQTPAGAGVPAPARANPARDLVGGYCVTCHNARVKTAGLSLDGLDAANVSNATETWEKVAAKLRSRSMPPAGIRRPDHAAYDAAADFLERELDRAAEARPKPGRPADWHRLNRTEYANAIRDLFGLEIDAAAMLPPDTQAHGFDNNGDALAMEPALLDRYLTAAARIARTVVGDPTLAPAVERYTAMKGNANEQNWLWQTERLGEDFPLGSRGGIAVRHYFPVDGEYDIRIRLGRTYADVIRGLQVPSEIQVRLDGVKAGAFTIGGPGFSAESQDADDALRIRVAVPAGDHQVVATVVRTTGSKAEGLGPDRIPIWNRDGDVPSFPLGISALLVGGPYNATAPKDSPTRRRVFVCRPSNDRDAQAPPSTEAPARSRERSPQSTASEDRCAATILSELVRRAYRRPATAEDVETLLAFYRQGRAERDFDTGIRAALERLLVSPDFLFRIETDPAGTPPDAAYRLSGVEIASRLSFFLWSSIPDDELLDLAITGQLLTPGTLDRQVRRMLADPRARKALVENFFGQWLQTRNVWLLTPDTNQRFPWFDDNLRAAFVREIELFLDDQLKADRSVLDLLGADYTFLNEQLARHYGIRGVYGSHFRRVTLTDQNRWGLLGKASVLAVTSYSNRTSPTTRGKWLLENVLAAPVPPPPPDVNTNLEEADSKSPASVREMLERHRANPTCASCHARMDPLGFSLENFDAIGQWRTTDGQAPINAAGVLLDGTKVEGPASLRRALVAQQELFVRAVVGKLMTYALGRELMYYDAPAVRAISRRAAADNYSWSSTIAAVVASTPFQLRSARP
jgi:mono/diheme cytochrome c family protein